MTPDATPGDTPTRVLLRGMEDLTRAVREASHVMSRQFPCSRGEVPVIRLLARRGSLGVGDIAHAMRVDVSVVSRQVSHLVEQGWVERTVDPDDRRARTLRLTPSGEAMAAHMGEVREAAMQSVFGGWSATELDDAADVLHRIAAAIDTARVRDQDTAPPSPVLATTT
ncbi:MarR family winged helix-turn-helix transcriptional regulator [Cellulomonas biazotea]|jgi:DNA-binding MarR family transcriptional regulator|uniref:MarR family transcriptional regulator n=1 Tax=Cellulomonas biazotea TaxID=1709 RepID=A0A402DMA0_9CELL|nr:MarR family winged helix-turn-helix transcriptional regulator [Cellulomonas biazotea]GCE75243.1 MarR family transcriptional regulator [Cellulomonas biazotea]